MTAERDIGGRRVVAPCSDELDPLGEDVLEMLDRLGAQAGPPPDFTRMRWAWSLLTLAPDGKGGLIVQEPDFDGDPMTDIRPSLDVTLTVVRDQGMLCRKMQAKPVDCWFDAWVMFGPGALGANAQRMTRSPPTGPSDSGWYVAAPGETAPPSDPGKLEARRAWELLRLLPDAVPALALPGGWSVSIVNGRIAGLASPTGAAPRT